LRRDLSILAIVALLLVGLFVSTEPSDKKARGVAGSTFAAGPGGSKAFYVLLDELGQKPRRWRQPGYRGLPARSAIWFFGGESIGQLSALALADHVRGGGIVVGPPETLRALFEHLKLGTLHTGDATLPLKTALGPGLESDKPVTVSANVLPDEVLVQADNGQSVVARWTVGKGSIIALGVPDIARNDRIGLAGNGVFLARLAYLLSPDNVFDEVQTGLGDTGLANLLLRVPYRFGVLQLFMALALLLLALLPRRFQAERAAPLRRRATLDHLEAVARLWSRARDPGLPLSELAAALAERARRHGGVGETPFVDWVAQARPDFRTAAQLAWARAQALLQEHSLAPEAARNAAAELLGIEREALRW
jgi:hypothetical protein